jgi:hypothetical protein
MTALTTPCREWQGAQKGPGAKCRRGYGNIRRGGRYWSVHRWVWTLANGPIPDGVKILHRCDNPPCFRLDHLFAGTQGDNMADKVEKGRASGGRHMADRTHCPQGHEYTEDNTYRFPSRPNERQCRTCVTERNREARRKRKEMTCQ